MGACSWVSGTPIPCHAEGAVEIGLILAVIRGTFEKGCPGADPVVGVDAPDLGRKPYPSSPCRGLSSNGCWSSLP